MALSDKDKKISKQPQRIGQIASAVGSKVPEVAVAEKFMQRTSTKPQVSNKSINSQGKIVTTPQIKPSKPQLSNTFVGPQGFVSQQERNAELKTRLLEQRNARLANSNAKSGFSEFVKTEAAVRKSLEEKEHLQQNQMPPSNPSESHIDIEGPKEHKDPNAKDEKDLLKKEKDIDNKRLNDLREGPKNSGNGMSGLGVLVILAIILHVLDFIGGFSRTAIGTSTIKIIPPYWLIASYLFIGVLGFWLVFKDNADRTSFGGAILLAMIIPAIALNFQTTIQLPWMDSITTLVLAFPYLVLYLMRKFPEVSFVKKATTGYFIIWTLIALVLFLSSSMFVDITKGTSTQINNPMQKVMGFFSGVGGAINKLSVQITASVQRGIAQATGQQYQSDQENQRGISLTNLKSQEQTYHTDSRPYFEVGVKAQNINEEVTVKFSCFIPDSNMIGKAYPQAINFVNNDENTVSCEFPSLKAGDYTVKVVGTFAFAQQATTTYYFINSNTKPDMYASLKIPGKATVVDTGGPVQVGLPALAQPLRIGDEADVGNYPFGVSLANIAWNAGGKVTKGAQYKLDVDNGIVLDECSRVMTSDPVTVNDRTIYTFDINSNNAQETFDSITCRLRVKNPAEFLAGNIFVAKTFAAKVEYEYSIEATAPLHVENTVYTVHTT